MLLPMRVVLVSYFISPSHFFVLSTQFFLILPLRHERVSCAHCARYQVYIDFFLLSFWAWTFYVLNVFFSFALRRLLPCQLIHSFYFTFCWRLSSFETPQYSYCIHLGLLRFSQSAPMCVLDCVYTTYAIRCQFEIISKQFSNFREIFLSKHIRLFRLYLCHCAYLCVNVCNFQYYEEKKNMTKRSQSRKMVLASTNLSYRKFCKTIITTAKYLLVSMSIRSYHIMFSFRKVVESIRKKGNENGENFIHVYSVLNTHSLFEIVRMLSSL